MKSVAWQQPFANILQTYPFEKWHRNFKGGNLIKEMDKEIRCYVYRLTGSIPAANFIQLPSKSLEESSSTSPLNLIGHLFYLLFKPISGKGFVFHLDVQCSDGQAVRISISNLYRELKWLSDKHLQLPYICVSYLPEKQPFDADRALVRSHIGLGKPERSQDIGSAPLKTQWTILVLNLANLFDVVADTPVSVGRPPRRFVSICGIQLCSNMIVKNLFTSDNFYNPLLTAIKMQKDLLSAGVKRPLHILPFPKQMSFPLLQGGSQFTDLYDVVVFPPLQEHSALVLSMEDNSMKRPSHPTKSSSTQRKSLTEPVVRKSSLKAPTQQSNAVQGKCNLIKSLVPVVKQRVDQYTMMEGGLSPPLVEVSVGSISDDDSEQNPIGQTTPLKMHSVSASALWNVNATSTTTTKNGMILASPNFDTYSETSSVHVQGTVADDPLPQKANAASSSTTTAPQRGVNSAHSHHPNNHQEPLMRLDRVIGCEIPCRNVLWSADNKEVIYPINTMIVAMEIRSKTKQQRFFIGHRNPVSSLALSSTSGRWLASGELGETAVIRLWNFYSCECVSVFKCAPNAHNLRQLVFSPSSRLLACVAKDSMNKSCLAIWDVHDCENVRCFARASTDADIVCACFHDIDEHRLITCGRNNIRLWRVKQDQLRGTQINLGEFQQSSTHQVLPFTYCQLWRPLCRSRESDQQQLSSLSPPRRVGGGGEQDLWNQWTAEDRLAFVCSTTGHLFEIDVQRFTLHHVRRLLPTSPTNTTTSHQGDESQSEGVPLTCLTINESFVVTASEDCYLRLWPHDFSHVYLEAQYDAPVESVQLSHDGLLILVGLSNGQVGFLDISRRAHTVLMRSHTQVGILHADVDPLRHHIATVGQDNSVRVWDVDKLEQVCDLHSSPSERPLRLAYRPDAVNQAKHLLLQNGAPTVGGIVVSLSVGFESGAIRVFDVERCIMIGESLQLSAAITGLCYSNCARFLYACDSRGTLILLSADRNYSLIRRISHCVSPPTLIVGGSSAAASACVLAVDPSPAERTLAVIGPSEFAVTCFDGDSLDELLRVDVATACSSNKEQPVSSNRRHFSSRQADLDSLCHVAFTRGTFNYIAVCTLQNRLLLLDKRSGTVVSQCAVYPQDSRIHASITALSTSLDANVILTAAATTGKNDKVVSLGNNNNKLLPAASNATSVIKVSNANLTNAPNSQQYLSHCGSRVTALLFSPDQNYLITVGDCIVLWRYFGSRIGNVPHSLLPPSGEDELPALSGSVAEVGESSSALKKLENPAASVVASNAHSNPLVSISQKNEILEEEPSNVCPAVQYCPQSYRHVLSSSVAPLPSLAAPSTLASSVSSASLMSLQNVIGCSAAFRGTSCPLIWDADKALLVFVQGRVLVLEDLDNGQQRVFPQVHSSAISCMALSPNADQLVTCSHARNSNTHNHDNSVCEIFVWNMQQAKEAKGPTLLKRLRPSSSPLSQSLPNELGDSHRGAVVSVAFSPDAHWCVTLGNYCQNLVCVWNASSWELLVCSVVRGASHQVLWSPSNPHLFVTCGSRDSRLVFWRLNVSPPCRGQPLACGLEVYEVPVPEGISQQSLGENWEFACAAFTTPQVNSELLFLGSTNGRLAVYDVTKMRFIMHWMAESTEIGFIHCAINSSSHHVVVGAKSGRLRLWSISQLHRDANQSSMSVTMEKELMLDDSVSVGYFDHLLDMGVVATDCGSIWYVNWSALSSDEVEKEDFQLCLISGASGVVTGLSWTDGDSSDTAGLICSCDDGNLQMWCANKREQMCQMQIKDAQCLCVGVRGHECVCGYSDGYVRLFDLRVPRLMIKVCPCHTDAIVAVAFLNNDIIICGSDKGRIALLDAPTGQVKRTVRDHDGAAIQTIQVFEDSKQRIYWLVSSVDRRISVWIMEQHSLLVGGELLEWISLPNIPMFTSQPQVDSREAMSSPCILPYRPQQPRSLAVFVDYDLMEQRRSSHTVVNGGPLLLYTGCGIVPQLHLYSVSSRTIVQTIQILSHIVSLAVTHDTSTHTLLAATGDEYGAITLYRLFSGEHQTFCCHRASVHCLAFQPSLTNPTDCILASASDREIFLWRVHPTVDIQ